MIPYGRQDISADDVAAVVEVLQSDFLTQGPQVPAFEQALQDYTGAGHAVAVNSATSALHIACVALGLGQGDWLWTSPITFVASANCALYCGAQVDFVDIDPVSYNLCPVALEKKLKEADIEGRLPKVLVPVHLAGQSCDMRAIKALSEKYGFYIIEDASHAIGGKYLDRPIGNCDYCDITVFSFHPVKIITTAEGGVATTNSKRLAGAMELLRSHGVTRDPVQLTDAAPGDWYYEQKLLGFNYRMTDLQAALGVSQMSRLDEFISRRHALAKNYDESLAGLPLQCPVQSEDTYSAYHLYVIRLADNDDLSYRRRVFDALRSQDIGVNVHYIPVHTQPFYREMGFKWGQFPNAEAYYQSAITIPLHPNLTGVEQETVIAELVQVLEY